MKKAILAVLATGALLITSCSSETESPATTGAESARESAPKSEWGS